MARKSTKKVNPATAILEALGAMQDQITDLMEQVEALGGDAPAPKRGKKAAPVEDEDEDFDEEEEEGEEEDDGEGDELEDALNELDLDELKALAKEFKIKLGRVGKSTEKAVDAILAAVDEDEDLAEEVSDYLNEGEEEEGEEEDGEFDVDEADEDELREYAVNELGLNKRKANKMDEEDLRDFIEDNMEEEEEEDDDADEEDEDDWEDD